MHSQQRAQTCTSADFCPSKKNQKHEKEFQKVGLTKGRPKIFVQAKKTRSMKRKSVDQKNFMRAKKNEKHENFLCEQKN